MTIRVSDRIQDLNGVGVEFLTDKDGNIIAEFVNGNMRRESFSTDPAADTIAQ